MSIESLDIAIFGLTITSSWGNGHASTYRGLVSALDDRGHRVAFLERDVSWYRGNRDLADPPFCRTHLYDSLEQLREEGAEVVDRADVVIIGSYVPDGIDVARWALARHDGPSAFYDIDTPVTLAKLERGDEEYLVANLIPAFDLYLSFSGGETLEVLETEYGARRARALQCAVDPSHYRPLETANRWLFGYLGTYSDDRRRRVERFLREPARRLADERFVAAGPQYPDDIDWPSNVRRIDHLPPPEHPGFYNSQKWTLNVTRDDMRRLGHSPSVRLFEAAACGTPIISDHWEGLEEYFEPGREILVADSSDEVVEYLTSVDEELRRQIGRRARRRVLDEHTPADRAAEFEGHLEEVLS
jgi:spore maturation protein CgeB